MADNLYTESQHRLASHIRLWPTLSAGVAMTCAVCFLMPYSAYVQSGSRISFGYVPMGTLMPFMVFAVILNPLLKSLGRRAGFNTSELTVIFIMGLVAATFPTLGLCGFLIAVLATPYYFASNQNQWHQYIIPYLPRWAIPTNEGNAMEWFFNGKPAGAAIPWEVWIGPLLWWSCFVAALFTLSICLMSILRRQWMEHERLVYPLAQLPIEIVREDERSVLPRIMRERMFWIGLCVPLGIILWNVLCYFHETLPRIKLIEAATWIRFARGMPAVHTKVNFFVISFAFFANLDVLFSMWLFHFLVLVEVGIFNRVGFTIGSADLWSNYHAATAWQSLGGFFFLAVSGFWIGRRHLWQVVRKAFDRNYAELEDSNELVSYRTAVVGAICATAFIIGWLRAMGMQWTLLALYFPAALLIYVGITKFVAQSGMIYMRSPVTAQSFAAYAHGSATLTPTSVAALAMTFAYCCDFKMSVFSSVARADKMAHSIGFDKKKLLGAIIIAIVLGFTLSLVLTLRLGYQWGAYNFGAWEFQRGNQTIINNAVSKLRNPQEIAWSRLAFMGGGGLFCALMTLLRYRFQWWPFHPLGFAVAGAAPGVFAEFSVFLAWLIKFVILKLGGMRTYERAKPFFVGTLVGYVLGVTFSFIVDIIWFPGMGHRVHHW